MCEDDDDGDDVDLTASNGQLLGANDSVVAGAVVDVAVAVAVAAVGTAPPPPPLANRRYFSG